jgi:hypothetical protein
MPVNTTMGGLPIAGHAQEKELLKGVAGDAL